MYLKIFISSENWKESKFITPEIQNDYNFFEKENIGIFIYGYPYVKNNAKWINAIDIFNFYSKNDLDFIYQLEGVYSIIILDRTKEACYVINDIFGIYSLFYYKNKDNIIISDKIKEIVQFIDGLEINKNSIYEALIFGYGHKLGIETHIKKIFEFEGAYVYSIKSGISEIIKNKYWDYPEKIENKPITLNKFRKIFNNHIETGLKLCDNFSLTLSGGLDTRTILSSAIKKRENIKVHTYGLEKSQDVKISKKISKHFSLNSFYNIINGDFINNIPKLAELNVDMCNGLIPNILFFPFKTMGLAAKQHSDLLILGLLGDEIWRYYDEDITTIEKLTNIDELVDYIIFNNKDTFCLFSNFNKDIFKKIIKKELNKYSYSFNSKNIIDYFHFKIFGSNWAGNLVKFCGQYINIYLGLISKKIIEKLIFVDLNKRRSGELEKYIVQNNNLSLSKIRYSSGKLKKIKIFSNRIFNKFLHKKIFKKFPELPVYYSNLFRDYHSDFILSILNYDKMITKDLFNKNMFQKAINSYLKGDDLYFPFTMSILSIELWLKNILNFYINKIEII